MSTRSKSDIAVKKKLAEEIFDSVRFIGPRWQETHGEDGPMRTLVDLKFYCEDQDLLKFGDLFAAKLNQIEN
jgi:hypothetical protein